MHGRHGLRFKEKKHILVFKGSETLVYLTVDTVPADVRFCQLNYSKVLILLLLNYFFLCSSNLFVNMGENARIYL